MMSLFGAVLVEEETESRLEEQGVCQTPRETSSRGRDRPARATVADAETEVLNPRRGPFRTFSPLTH